MKADLKKLSLRTGLVLALSVLVANGALAQGGSRASNDDDEAPPANDIDAQTVGVAFVPMKRRDVVRLYKIAETIPVPHWIRAKPEKISTVNVGRLRWLLDKARAGIALQVARKLTG